ncbi:MAG: O-methyltransferase [Planctomycetales bacterium]|nr:O-methyltransferase [bacterium]UNM08730.1 MAG: O-methyltransferase [Planctomycetales bacterium]
MSDTHLWSESTDFMEGLMAPADPVLEAVQRSADEAGLPQISLSPLQARLMQVLAGAIGARRILEVGTLAGFSGIHLARALPVDGKLITLEIDDRHADVAQANFERAGVADRVELIRGAAVDSLEQLAAEGCEPFDMAFIDADKVNNVNYLKWATEHSRSGALIVIDNVVRGGQVATGSDEDPSVAGTRAALRLAAEDDRLEATVIQTVGRKNFDGLCFIRRK